jgi:hypothetical protein
VKAIIELESMGYMFTIDGDKLRGTCDSDPTDPDKADVAELRRLLGEYPPIVEGGRRPGPPRGI